MMVYRVEHRERRFGPYIPSLFGLSTEEERLRHEATKVVNADQHPTPRQDGLGDIHRDEFSCFTSLEALCEWFGDDSLDLLYRAGYGVFPFEVDEAYVREGRRQALFFRGSAVRMDELEPVSRAAGREGGGGVRTQQWRPRWHGIP